jgi:predicted lysophospholipase L1 biosynthesis ABC-type transport system permease subunit
VVVATSRARKLFADGRVLGKTLRFGASPGPDTIEGEVIGVAGDVKDNGLDSEAWPLFYGLVDQATTTDMTVVMKTSVPPYSLAEAVRREVRALDPALPVTSVASLEDVVSRSVARPRFYALLLAAFASVALVLASVGLYGVIAYGVMRRTREIGVRVALGAGPADVLALVLSEGVRLLGAGLALGLVLTLATTRLLKSLLFGVSPTDPASLALLVALLSGVALFACAVPSLRAARLDPVEAIRAD